MKKTILSVVLILGLSLCFLPAIFGLIQNSHHDFRGAGWSDGEICNVCHTPHNADILITDAPLWDHESTAAAYTVYSSTTMDASVLQPNGHSKLCLSCHDGTVAIDSYGGTAGTAFLDASRFGYFGTDLAPHHPISFSYDTTLSTNDGELHDPAVTATGLGGTISDDLLFGNLLECSSCHDVHVSRNTAGTCTGCHFGGNGTLSLRMSNNGSALCMTCHDK